MKKLTSITLIFSTLSLQNCTFYDEEDKVIISYLKLNDLLENKISETKNNNDFNYANENNIYFFNNYFVENNNINTEKLQKAISMQLWNYYSEIYSKEIPTKAINQQELSYFTINELREKYPDYKEVEIDIQPTVLINKVMKEKLFLGNDINLKTLYFYSQNTNTEENNSAENTNSKNNGNTINVQGFEIFIPKEFEKHGRMKDTYVLYDQDGGDEAYFSYEILSKAKSPYELYPEACNADYSGTDTDLFVSKQGENGEMNTIWYEYKKGEKWCLLTVEYGNDELSKNIYEFLGKSR